MALFRETSVSRVVDGPDGPIHFHDVGTGPPIVLQQAFGPLPGTTAWLTWHDVVARLRDSYRCILMDFPNFGLSGPQEFHEPVHDVCARNSFHVMDLLDIASATLIGASMGGTVALDMALARPDRVDRLVVGGCHASTGGDPYTLAAFPSEVLRLFVEGHSPGAGRAEIARLLRALVRDEASIKDDLVDAIYRWRQEDPAHLETWQRSESLEHSNLDVLSTIRQPMLIVHGRHDRMVPLEQALTLMSYVPQADLVVLNECGHWPSFEYPAKYARTVRNFLDETG